MRTTLLAALLLCSCAASHQPAPSHPETVRTEPDTGQQKVDTSAQKVESSGILSAVGALFSTPEGTARRQAVKLAKASVPRKCPSCVFTSGTGNTVAVAGKKAGPVVQADSGASVNLTAIGKNKAPNASAPNATATATTETGLSYWWLLLIPVGLAVVYRKRLFPLLFA